MKKIVFGSLIGFLFFVLILVSCKKSTKPEPVPTTGSILVDSNPGGADIWLDETNTGFVTPCTLASVSPGEHQLKLTKIYCKDWFQKVIVTAGKTTLVYAILETLPTSIMITSTPPGAAIVINDSATGMTTPAEFININYGFYDIRLLLANHFPFDTSFYLGYKDIVGINALLDSVPPFKVAYTVKETLWVVGLDGLNSVKYAEDARIIDGGVIWSPDGNYLTYASNSGMSILSRDGWLKGSFVFADDARAYDFSWSHSSQVQVNGSYDDGIYSYSVSTNELKKILQTQDYTYDHNPVFSLNDSSIAFLHHEYGGSCWIRLMNPDGSNQKTVSTKMITSYDENLNLYWISNDEILFKNLYEGIYLLKLSSYDDSIVSPNIVVSNPSIYYLRVSPNLLYYAFVSYPFGPYYLYYGVIGQWSSTLIMEAVIYDIAWSPANDAIACRTVDGVYWVTLSGKKYHIVKVGLEPYILNGGVSVTR